MLSASERLAIDDFFVDCDSIRKNAQINKPINATATNPNAIQANQLRPELKAGAPPVVRAGRFFNFAKRISFRSVDFAGARSPNSSGRTESVSESYQG